jgi:head-tail adaptor
MPSASQRTELIVFQRATTTEDDYGQPIETWADYATRRARVRFGTAQESASQTATFECLRSTKVDSVTVKDRIVFDGSDWDITSRDPLDRKTVRFTGVRLAD